MDWNAVLDVLSNGGPWGFIGLIILAIVRGYLVPKGTVNMLLKYGDDAMAAFKISEQARVLQAKQIEELFLEYARATNAILESLPDVPIGSEDAS